MKCPGGQTITMDSDRTAKSSQKTRREHRRGRWQASESFGVEEGWATGASRCRQRPGARSKGALRSARPRHHGGRRSRIAAATTLHNVQARRSRTELNMRTAGLHKHTPASHEEVMSLQGDVHKWITRFWRARHPLLRGHHRNGPRVKDCLREPHGRGVAREEGTRRDGEVGEKQTRTYSCTCRVVASRIHAIRRALAAVLLAPRAGTSRDPAVGPDAEQVRLVISRSRSKKG